MTRYGQTVSIAATTSGVAGTITVPKGAHITGLNMSYPMVDDIVTKIAISFAGQKAFPMNFTPPIAALPQATEGAVSTMTTPLIDLDISVTAETAITITLTSTGNITVRVGLMWDA